MKRIVITIEAIKQKEGDYIMNISYCFDDKCSPSYEPDRKEARQLVKMCLETGDKIKKIYLGGD